MLIRVHFASTASRLQWVPSFGRKYTCPINKGLVSLWDMVNLFGSIILLLETVEACRARMIGGMVREQTEAAGDTVLRFIDGQELTYLREMVERIKQVCTELEIESALQRIARIERDISSAYNCTFTNMRRHIGTLRENIEDDLTHRIFWYIPRAKIEYLLTKKDLPFPQGPEFIHVQSEYFEAAQCLAFERHTACVMHTTRLAELCLRAIGRHLLGNHIGTKEIEFVDWKPMLTAIELELENQLNKLANEPRTEERERAVRFYTDSRSHLAYFKNVRDEASHARTIRLRPSNKCLSQGQGIRGSDDNLDASKTVTPKDGFFVCSEHGKGA
jgi:hypothetical protein